MARSAAAAIAEAKAREGERFDRAVGLLVQPPSRASTPFALRKAFRGIGRRELDGIVLWLVKYCRCSQADAEEATQQTFEKKLRSEPEFFETDREEWWPRLCGMARFTLLEIRDSQRRIVLTDAQVDPAISAASEPESSALPVSPAACDYTWVNPPPTGEDWSEIQILGALQRFARHYERPPREIDCKALHRLPSPPIIRVHFGTFGNALWKAGIRSGLRRIRTKADAARECRAFRQRNGRWPDARDLRWSTGELPSRKTMVRLVGTTNPGVVQQRVEEILGR